MNENETAYLIKYRELLAKKNRIVAMISELRGICESLKDWQKTAADLSLLGSDTLRPEWSDDRLKGLVSLRSYMTEYHRQTEQLAVAWSKLTMIEKSGLMSPDKI